MSEINIYPLCKECGCPQMHITGFSIEANMQIIIKLKCKKCDEYSQNEIQIGINKLINAIQQQMDEDGFIVIFKDTSRLGVTLKK